MGKPGGAAASAGCVLSRVVKQQAGRLRQLRVHMKRSLPLTPPPPFVVSRGYTPEYPWLGQQHPEPDASTPRKRPRLLMQQASSCLGCWKTVVAVACIVAGLTLIAYAGHAIVRGAGQRQGLWPTQRSRQRQAEAAPAPKHEALVQAQAAHEPPSSTLPPRTVPDAVAHLADGKVEADDGPRPELTVEVSLPVNGDQVDEAADSVPVVIRLVDPVGAGEEAAAPVVVLEAGPGHVSVEAVAGGEELPSAPEETPVDDDSDDGDLAAVDDVPEGGSLEATRRMLLLMRLANIAGAQQELAQLSDRVLISETLRRAYDDLETAEDAAAGAGQPGAASESGQPDGPTHFVPLVGDGRGDGQQDEAPQDDLRHDQDQQGGPEEQPQEVGDEEQLRAVLQWLWTNGQAWNEAQDRQQEGVQEGEQEQVTDEQQLGEILRWLWNDGRAWNEAQDEQDEREEPHVDHDEDDEQVRAVLQWLQQGADGGSAPADAVRSEESVPAARRMDSLSLDEDEQPEMLTWDQLNEDDKQDAVLPHMAARGVGLVGAEPVEPEVLDDVHLTGVERMERLGDERLVVPVRPGILDDVHLVGVEEKERLGDHRLEVPVKPELHDDIHLTGVVQEALPEVRGDVHPRQDVHHHHHDDDDDAALREEWQHVQGYRGLLSQRVPLMYHVLQLRREQTAALQQEQRATAYLRLLDLHLLQHQQEAAARRALRQHGRDQDRLDRYARYELPRHQREYEHRLLQDAHAHAHLRPHLPQQQQQLLV